MSVKITTAYFKIKSLKNKIKVIQGGQGASKTYSILILLFEYSINNPGIKSTVVTETYPQLKDGVIADMESIINSAGLNWDQLYNKSEKNLTLSNKSMVQFRNIDNKDFHKAKGARREYLFINEANRVAWGSLEQLWTRTDKGIFIDYNPDREFWYHDRVKDETMGEHDFLILTYKDNEMLSAGECHEIELRKSNKLWWQIYGLGQLGVYSDRQIYNYDFIDQIPPDAKRIFSGMDFGLSPDPTTLVNLYVKGVDLYADEIFTENNLAAEKIEGSSRMSVVDKMKEVRFESGWKIIADSANKTHIRDLNKNKYNVYPVKKYAGSVIDGIGIVKSYNLKITKRSTGIKKGCESWFFKVDDNNKIIPEPDGHEPDQLAAIRYALMQYTKSGGGFTI